MAASEAEAIVIPGLDAVEDWARSGEGMVAAERLTDLRGAIARAATAGDRERLDLLRDRLNPAAAALNRRLARAGVEPWVVQAAGTTTLAAVVRGALSTLDRLRPDDVLARIPHGAALLRALHGMASDVADGEYVPVSLDRLRDALGAEGEAPSRSRVSRSLTALEVAGFVHLSGATRARVAALLPPAHAALAEAEAQAQAPARLDALRDRLGFTTPRKGAEPGVFEVESQSPDDYAREVGA